MQSFLRSLNYYSCFIEDFAIYAFVLYELRETDLHEISRDKDVWIFVSDTEPDRDSRDGSEHITGSNTGGDLDQNVGGDPDSGNRSRWKKAVIAFTLLKAKFDKTPILKHFDPYRSPVIVVYASKWVVSAAFL